MSTEHVTKKKSKSEPSGRRVIGYIRVSTEQQADQGNSLEAQRSKIEAYAQLYGLELVRVEIDAGLSASSLERPALRSALADLDSGAADALLVVKLDRLTRSVRDLCDLVENHFSGRARLMSVSENIDTSSASGRLVLNILVTVSQWEREAAAERTTAVMQHLKATGCFTGGWPPFGYSVNEDGALIENVAEQAIIVRARALRASGMSLREVAAALPPNRKGATFDAKQIQRMM